MKQPKENSEFRCVHAASEALVKYKKSGRDINVIRAVKNIDRFDVWMTVFNEEKEAVRELQIRELYDIASKFPYTKCPEGAGMIYITLLTNLVEHSTPLNLEDGIKVIVDALGENCIPLLKEKAKRCYEIRLEIISPYFKKDNEWTNKSKKVITALNKITKL